MDSMELLRTHYDDQPPVSDERLRTIRHQLDLRFLATQQAPMRRPALTRPRIVGIAGAVVGVTALVAVLVTAPPAAPAANATELLQRASQHASATDLAGAGSVVEFTSRTLDQVAGDGEAELAYTTEGVTLLKIPVGDERWMRKSWTTAVRYAYGDEDQMPKPGELASKEDPLFETSKSGAFVNNPPARSSAYLGAYPDDIRDLPRDPEALLAALKADSDGSPSSAGQVLQSASMVLTSGVADSSLQSAIFTALQKVPDLTIVDRHATDLDGRAGVAIGLKPGAPDRVRGYDSTELLIDARTGQYLGQRTVSLRKYGVTPAGTELDSTAMRTDVRSDAGAWQVPTGRNTLDYP